MRTIHHVNLGVPEDGLEAEARFLVDVIGLRRVPPGEHVPPTANWFDADGGTQIHLSRDPNHRAADRAHVAFEFGDDLVDVERALTTGRIEFRVVESSTGCQLVCRDPAGNRWELRGRLPGGAAQP